MARPRLSPRADADLKCIQAYVAQFDHAAALRRVRRINQILAMIGRQPLIGEARDDIQPGIRCFTCDSYVIYYEPTRPRVSILRIVHSARDHEGLV
jgi:toxin ParE1/3/4